MLLIPVLSVGGALLWLMATARGSVLISMEDYVIQFSLWTGLLTAFLALGLLGFSYKLLRALFSPGWHLLARRQQRRHDRWRVQNSSGLLALAEGRWDKAVTDLLQTADEMVGDTRLISYLGAAKAAAAKGETDLAISTLYRAENSGLAISTSPALARVRILLDKSRYKEALQQILPLYSKFKNDPEILLLLTRLYRVSGEWQKLEQLLPDLAKNNVFDKQQLLDCKVMTYCALFRDFSSHTQTGAERLIELNKLWARAKKSLKTEPKVLGQYVTALNALGEPDSAEVTLRRAINKHYSKEHILLYGKLQGIDPMAQVVVAERWLKDRPEDPDLLLTLGRLCKNNRLWAKGRDYLSASLNISDRPQTCAELADLLIALGEEREACKFFERGLRGCLKSDNSVGHELVK